MAGTLASATRARVMVVDDHAAVRAGVGALLADEATLDVVAVAADTGDALRRLRRQGCDVAIVDYNLPDKDGLWLCLRMKTSLWPPRVLVYSAFADDRLAIMGTIAGAEGILAKEAGPDELSDAVHAVARGENLLPRPSPLAMSAIARRLDSDDLPILGMLLNGVPAHEIAPTLGIAEDWLTTRRIAMLDRLGERPARRGASSA